MNQPTLFLMLGYPGAGKTTTAEIVSELTGAVKLSSDQIRLHMFKHPKFTQDEHDAVYGTLDYLTELLLGRGVSVIYDANLNRFQHRLEKYEICERTGAKSVVLWLRTETELAKKRATELGHTDPARRVYGNLSPEVFDRLAREIEPPREDEQVIELDGTNLQKQTVAELLDRL